MKSKQNEIDNLVLNITNDRLLEKDSSNLVGIHGAKNDKTPLFIKVINFMKLSKIRNFYLPKPQKELIKIFEKTQEFAKKNNSELHIVYMPAYQRYKGLSYSIIKNQIKNISKELNINLIDIDKEIFSKEKDPFIFFPFGMYGHYTVDAYDKISKKIDSLVSK